MRPECGLHRKFFVYDDENDTTKWILFSSWSFIYDVGQYYYVHRVSRATWDFTNWYREIDLSREEYLGQMFRPEDGVAKSDLPEVERAYAHDSSRYGISRWDVPHVAAVSFHAYFSQAKTDLYVSYRADGWWNRFKVKSIQNFAFLKPKVMMKCHGCKSNKCWGCVPKWSDNLNQI